MKLTRTLVASAAALALVASFAPALTLADGTSTCVTGSTWWNFWSGANINDCVQGQLLVYVSVLNNYTGPTANPHDFTVNVSGQNVSNPSFPGSNSGTPLWVTGSYTVAASGPSGYQASYSQGCTGSVINNEQATCNITENATTPYYPIPTPYPYPYQPVPFTCTASQPTAALGQTVTFNAQGGDVAGPYNWQVEGRSYYSTGPTLSVALMDSGTQLATVTHGSQTTTCSINVATSGYYPAPTAPILPTPGAPTVYVTPTYVPALPNTGFEPLSATGVAYALAALIAAALMSFPYVRKAFAALLG